MSRRVREDVGSGTAFAAGPRHRRRRRLRTAARALPIVLAVGLGGLAGYTLVGLETAEISFPLAGTVPAPERGSTYWGVYRLGLPHDRDALTSLEDAVGRRPAIVLWFQEWSGEPSFPASDAAWLYERGVVPLISWEAWEPRSESSPDAANQPGYRLSNIASGAFDPYVRRYAEAVRRYGGPVMLRPFHEMDGNWYPWGGTVNGNSPADFIAAWRHLHDVFEKAGATNVTWVWSVNHLSYPATPENAIDRYWPGDAYVDWVGISGFNWGLAPERNVWQDFDEVNGDRYRELLDYGKPIAVTETAAPEVGGDKAVWIRQTFAELHSRYPSMAAVIWYDRARRVDESLVRDYRIDSSPASLEAFREAVAGPFILSARSAHAAATNR